MEKDFQTESMIILSVLVFVGSASRRYRVVNEGAGITIVLIFLILKYRLNSIPRSIFASLGTRAVSYLDSSINHASSSLYIFQRLKLPFLYRESMWNTVARLTLFDY